MIAYLALGRRLIPFKSHLSNKNLETTPNINHEGLNYLIGKKLIRLLDILNL